MMRIAFTCLFLSLLLSFSAQAQDTKSPYAPKTMAELKAQNTYYAQATIVFHQADGTKVNQSFASLTDAQKANLPGPVPPSQRQRMTTMSPLPAGAKVHVSSAGRVRIEQ